MTANPTFDQLQSRNYSVLAAATRLCSLLAGRSKMFTAHCKWVPKWLVLEHSLSKLLADLDNPLVTGLTAEQTGCLVSLMRQGSQKITELIADWEELGLRSTMIYARIVDKVESKNVSLIGRAEYLHSAAEQRQQTMVLSRRDQSYFVEAVSNPTGPNAKLRNAAVRSRETLHR